MSVIVSNPPFLPETRTSFETSATHRFDARYWVVVAACLLGGLAFLIDLPISRWMHTGQALKVLHQPLQVAEALGDGWGVAVVLITMYVVNVSRRRELWRVLCTMLATGLVSNIIKLCVSRLRPRSFEGDGLLHVSSVFDTFHGWLPFLQGKALAGSRYQSFPSGHTATGFALAVALTHMYPRAAWWFTTLALAIALQRVETGAHYVSDTCFGAALGLIVALSFQQGTAWAKWFDRLEAGETTQQV